LSRRPTRHGLSGFVQVAKMAGGPSAALSDPSGGRTWWAHLDFTRINIELTILRKKIEELTIGKKEIEETPSSRISVDHLDLRAFQGATKREMRFTIPIDGASGSGNNRSGARVYRSRLREQSVQNRTPFLLTFSVCLPSVTATGRWQERGRRMPPPTGALPVMFGNGTLLWH
jgi:hypothetical protein